MEMNIWCRANAGTKTLEHSISFLFSQDTTVRRKTIVFAFHMCVESAAGDVQRRANVDSECEAWVIEQQRCGVPRPDSGRLWAPSHLKH